MDPDPQGWAKQIGLKTTADVAVPHAAHRPDHRPGRSRGRGLKAAEQGRHLLLIGDRARGKSMLAKAMTEILPQVRRQGPSRRRQPEEPTSPSSWRRTANGRPKMLETREEGATLEPRVAHRRLRLVCRRLPSGIYLWVFLHNGPMCSSCDSVSLVSSTSTSRTCVDPRRRCWSRNC